MNTPSSKVETIIDGSTELATIAHAIHTYMDGLTEMAFPPELGRALALADAVDTLRQNFQAHVDRVLSITTEIILQINARAEELRSPTYKALQEKDKSLWRSATASGNVQFGVLVCVDKGISAEAVGIDVSNVGRVLAGDIEFSYIPGKNTFYPVASALIKRFIHYGRQGRNTLVEPIIEHTSCGRRGQILANEEAHATIPSLGFIFDHLDALFPGSENNPDHAKRLEAIRKLWLLWPRKGSSVSTPDKGLYAGIVQKIAQRQALSQLKRDIRIISPIEVYEKETGNLYAGLDAFDVLTDPIVLSAGGFTPEVLTSLSSTGRIFSLSAHTNDVYADIGNAGTIPKGAREYKDLQHHWLESITDLVSITETLWALLANNTPSVTRMIEAFFRSWDNRTPDQSNDVDRRIIHHLFHVAAYAYLFDTLTRGHEPGVHHIEEYLATGDHEIGTKPSLALGQGDLDRPSASEIFTGYSVLLHSRPGHDGTPIPVLIKLDTDRSGDKPMSTEETNVAFDDLHEFLKLWPYFLVGDIVPILMVRGKHTGGVSRLGLSIIRSLGDITVLLEQSSTYLPRFVPANNSNGAVVLVPAKNVLHEGIAAKGNLKAFRHHMVSLADQFTDEAVQRSFLTSLAGV